MYCTKCGKQLINNVGNFCSFCGASINKESTNNNIIDNSQKINTDLPPGVLWSLILLCTHSVMWAIACFIYFENSPLVSTWNIVWTIFGGYVIYKLFKRSLTWYNTALWITGVDAVWLLYQYFSSNINQLFLYISIIDVIAFILLIVNRNRFRVIAK